MSKEKSVVCPQCGVEVGAVVMLCEGCRKRIEQDAKRKAEEESLAQSAPLTDALTEKARIAANVDSSENKDAHQFEESPVVDQDNAPAGIVERTLAAVLDFSLIGMLGLLLWVLIDPKLSSIRISLALWLKQTLPVLALELSPSLQLFLPSGILFSALCLVIGLIYFSVAEASRLGGSVGKTLLGLEVQSCDGGEVGIFRAAFRNVSKIFSAMLLGLGFFLPLVNQRRQMLHDCVASCLVLRVNTVGVGQTLIVFGASLVFCLTMFSLLAIPIRSRNNSERTAVGFKRSDVPIAAYNVYGVARFTSDARREFVSAAAVWNERDRKLIVGLFATALSPEVVAQIRETRSFHDLPQREEMTRLTLQLGDDNCDRQSVSMVELEDSYLTKRKVVFDKERLGGPAIAQLSCQEGSLSLKIKLSDPGQGLQMLLIELETSIY